MNKNIKNAVIGFVALAIIIVGVKMAMTSKDSENMDLDTATASSTVISVGTSTSGSQIDDGRTRDANGCITSADYVWDAKIGSCVHKSKVSASSTATTSKPVIGSLPAPIAQNLCTSVGGQWSEKVRECLGITKNVCESISGQFAECASACRNDPAAQVCTAQCVQVCSIK